MNISRFLGIFQSIVVLSIIPLFVGCGGSGGGGDNGSTGSTSFSISGAVSGAVSSGMTITLSGASSATTTTDASGNYTFSGLNNGNYIIAPSLPGYVFNPTSSSKTIIGSNLYNINFSASRDLLINLKVSAANSYHVLNIKSDGTLWAWGDNHYGELGDGTNTNRNAPVQIGTDNNWIAVSAGGYKDQAHSAAIMNNGTLWTWGWNQNGQLGDGTNTDKNTPVQIGKGSSWGTVAAGGYHTLAIKSDGTLWAWGLNQNGQLGDGTNTDSNTPVQVGTGSNWRAVGAGFDSSYALKKDGTLWAWGNDNSVNAPSQIGTSNNWIALSVASWCDALKSDGSIWTCQGTVTPVQVGTDTDWISVSVGGTHTLALKSNGTLWAWEDNRCGQLGDGTTNSADTPQEVGSDNNWTTIAAGGLFSIAMKPDGTLWSWGYNEVGQLGDGTNVDKKVPTKIY